MHYAAGMGELEIVQLLFSIAPLMDRNAATKDGRWTPAEAMGHLETVPNDKNPENRDGNGLTPLQFPMLHNTRKQYKFQSGNCQLTSVE
jgi:ankyrin repeat protein